MTANERGDLAPIEARRAEESELEQTVRLRWSWAAEFGVASVLDEEEYVTGAAQWAREHAATHVPHIALRGPGLIVGMAWLALTPRVPTTKSLDRWSGDLQSCYVVPEQRGRGIGAALVRAVLATAGERGVEHVTVHATADNAARLYAGNGFVASERLLLSSLPEVHA